MTKQSHVATVDGNGSFASFMAGSGMIGPRAIAVTADGCAATPADLIPEVIAALAPLRAQVCVREAPEITARYLAHFGARVNGLELADCRGDPKRLVTEPDIVAKMAMLAEWGGLDTYEADRAVQLALRGDDAAAISAMLQERLA